MRTKTRLQSKIAYDKQITEMENQLKELQAFLKVAKGKPNVNFAHVGTLAHYNETLHQVTDEIQGRGEFSEVKLSW